MGGSTDPIDDYLKKHDITKMLNGIVNDLVASMPDDPISFLINGLLKEASTRQQEPALLLRLQELKQTLLKDQKAADAALGDKKKLEDENKKLSCRITHLLQTLDELEKGGDGGGGGGGGGGSTAGATPSLANVPPGHTPFSWAGGVEFAGGGGGAVAAPAAAGAPAAGGGGGGAKGGLTPERFSNRVAVATLLSAGDDAEGKHVVACGWVRTNRVSKKLCFMSINDGSTNGVLQLVIEKDKVAAEQWEAVKTCGNGAAVRVEGTLKASPAAGQR